jgi:G3E family GTPase
MSSEKLSQNQLEPLVVFVGFLGSGKTTLLRKIIPDLLKAGYEPQLILNDYQNAGLDATWFREQFKSLMVNPMSGSCVCCSGLRDLQFALENRPEGRKKPITLIEANGTTDSYDLLSFLGVNLEKNSLEAPLQITPVNGKDWKHRGDYNQLEENQVRTAGIVHVTWTDSISPERLEEVKADLKGLNSRAEFWKASDFQNLSSSLDKLSRSNEVPPNREADPESLSPQELSERKKRHENLSHWSSCELDLPESVTKAALKEFLNSIEIENLRLKGCVRLSDEFDLMYYFEKTLSGDVLIRPFPGQAAFNGKMILIAPRIDAQKIKEKIGEYF